MTRQLEHGVATVISPNVRKPSERDGRSLAPPNEDAEARAGHVRRILAVNCASRLQREKQESKRAEQELEGRLMGPRIAVRSVVSSEVRQMRTRLVTGPVRRSDDDRCFGYAPHRTIEMSPKLKSARSPRRRGMQS